GATDLERVLVERAVVARVVRAVAVVLRDLAPGGLLDPRDELVRAHVDAAASARCLGTVDAARHRTDHDGAGRGIEIDRAAGVAEAAVGIAGPTGDELAARR